MASYNKLKSTTVYGTFQNADASGNQANVIFDRNLTVSGILNTAHIQNSSGDIDISANNVIFKGGHMQFNNDTKIDIHQLGGAYPPATLQFPSSIDLNTVSTTSNNGMCFYSNLSGGANETNFVSFCPWQGGGGFSFYSYSFNQTPKKRAEFLPWNTYLSTAVQFTSTYTVGEWGATTQYVNYRLSFYLTNDLAAAYYQSISEMSNYLLTADASNNFLKLNDASNNYLKTLDASNNYLKIVDASNNYLKIVDASNNYLKIVDASNNFARLSTNNTYNGINTFNTDLTVSGIINASKLYNNSGDIDLSGNSINVKSFKISKFIMIPNTSTPSSATLLSNYGCYYFNGNTPYISFNNGTTINTNILATTADLFNYSTTVDISNNYLKLTDASNNYLKTVDASNNYLTITNASSTYLTQSSASSIYLSTSIARATYMPLVSMSAYLTTASASSTYQTIANMSNYIQTGGNIPFNTNIATLQFPSTFPTVALNNNNTGMGFYWNQSGGAGETDLICYGQGGTGGLSIWAAGNTTAPTQIANFYLNNINFTYTPTFPTTTNIGNYGATTSWVNTYFQPVSGMSNYLTTSSASSTYLTQSSARSTYMPLVSMSAYPQLSTSNTFTGSTNTFNQTLVIGTSVSNLTISPVSNYMYLTSSTGTTNNGIYMFSGSANIILKEAVLNIAADIQTNNNLNLLKDAITPGATDPKIIWYDTSALQKAKIYANTSTSQLIFDTAYDYVFTANNMNLIQNSSATDQTIDFYNSNSKVMGGIYTNTSTQSLCFDVYKRFSVSNPQLLFGFSFIGGSVSLGTGFRGLAGAASTSYGNIININWTGSSLQSWVDTSNIGNFTISDYRIKENIQPCSDVLDRLCSVPMFNYELKDISFFKKNGTHCGFYAHELQEAFPELNNIVSGEKDALNDEGDIQPQTIQPEFCNLLMKAIQELNQKIVSLQNRIIELEKINK